MVSLPSTPSVRIVLVTIVTVLCGCSIAASKDPVCKVGQFLPSADEAELPSNMKITTFNILAPQYFRTHDKKTRKEAYMDSAVWLHRNQVIAEFLQEIGSDIFCLQEFWLPTDDKNKAGGGNLVLQKFQEVLKACDFVTKKRGGNKEDGVVVAFRRDRFEYVDQMPVEFQGFFHHNRVGLVVHLRALPSGFPSLSQPLDVFVATTHVLFPNWNLELSLQKEEVRTMCEAIESLKTKADTNPERTAVVFAGDFNAPNPRGRNTERRQQSRTILAQADGDEKGTNPLFGIVERVIRPFLTSAYEWYEVLEEFQFEASHVAVHGAKGGVVTHINHEQKQVECDFLFFKGSIEPMDAYLEPQHIPEDMLLARPVVEPNPKSTATDVSNAEPSKFQALWATISDHRPKTAVYKFASSQL